MQVNLDTSLNVGKTTQQENLQSVLNTLNTKTEPMPILGSKSLSVSQAPASLDKLVAKLEMETNNTRENVAKSSLSSVFSTIIANAERNIENTDNNMIALDDAKKLNNQLKATESQITAKTKEVDQLTQMQKQATESVQKAQENVNSAQSNVNALQEQVDTLTEARTNLNTEIAAETDPTKKAELEAKRDVVDAQLTEATEQLTEAQNTLSSAKTTLTSAQTNLSNVNSQLTAAQNELSSLKEKKETLTAQIKGKLAELKDTNVNRAINDALRSEAKTEVNFDELEEDDKEDEEKYLNNHSPLRIMQDAILNHDSEILDTINSKREDKI